MTSSNLTYSELAVSFDHAISVVFPTPALLFLGSFATYLRNPSQQARSLGGFRYYPTPFRTTESVGRIHNLSQRDSRLWIPTLKYYTHVLRKATAIPNRLADMNNNFFNIVLMSN